MKYISVTSPDGAAQYILLSSLFSVSVPEVFDKEISVCISSVGNISPEEYRVKFGRYKTNSWSLYRMLKKCGICASFSIF